MRKLLVLIAALFLLSVSPARAATPWLVLYDGTNYTGPRLQVYGDVPNLTSLGWNDRASSMFVFSGYEYQSKLWIDANYSGSTWLVPYASIPDLGHIGGLNTPAYDNSMSSVDTDI